MSFHILVIGGGVMGRGIALVSARAGYPTYLYDIQDTTLRDAQQYIEGFLSKSVEKGKLTEETKTATLQRLTYTASHQDIKVDVVIEAIPERIDLKHKVLNEIAAGQSDHTILASNTSTLAITKIAAGLPHPERVVGMHFFNPAPLMKLVEVISGLSTAPKVTEQIIQLAKDFGKTPVSVKDGPGFIVNRVARQFYLENLRQVESGAPDIATVDAAMKNLGFRMGPFELLDLIGIDTNLSVSQRMFEAFFYEDRFRPSRLQQHMVDAGFLGRKSGKGFYDYKKNKPNK